MEVVIFVGLQASGKSTFFRSHFAATHTYVSKDLLRNNKRPARRQLQLVDEALRAGQSVVIDNTNPSPEDRSELIALGHFYQATVSGYFFEIQLKRSQRWNAQREGKARVPDVGLYSTLKKMAPPRYQEGFDQLYQILLREDFQFVVLPWPQNEPGSDSIITDS